MESSGCPKCRGTGRILDSNGTIGPCFDCLNRGEFDQHDKKGADSTGFSMERMKDNFCPKCNGTGRIKSKDGSIGTCFDCLIKGSFDQHDKKTKSAEDLRIKL